MPAATIGKQLQYKDQITAGQLKIKADDKMKRPDKDTYYLLIAAAVSLRSTCLRRHYGAVLVKNDEILSTGYNGSARGAVNCCDTSCCARIAANKPHNSSYDSSCLSVHAECNCLLSVNRSEAIGSILYLYGYDCITGKVVNAVPCEMCQRLVQTCGVARVVGSTESFAPALFY